MSKEESSDIGGALVRRPRPLSPGGRTAIQYAAAPAITAATLLATPVASHVLSTAPHILGDAAGIGLGAGVAAVGLHAAGSFGRHDGGVPALAAVVASAAGVAGLGASTAALAGGDIVGSAILPGLVGGVGALCVVGIRSDASRRSVPPATRARHLNRLTRVAAPVGAAAAAADIVQQFGAAHVMSSSALGGIAAGGLATAAATGFAAWREKGRSSRSGLSN